MFFYLPLGFQPRSADKAVELCRPSGSLPCPQLMLCFDSAALSLVPCLLLFVLDLQSCFLLCHQPSLRPPDTASDSLWRGLPCLLIPTLGLLSLYLLCPQVLPLVAPKTCSVEWLALRSSAWRLQLCPYLCLCLPPGHLPKAPGSSALQPRGFSLKQSDSVWFLPLMLPYREIFPLCSVSLFNSCADEH